MSVVPYAYECYKSSVLQYKEYTLRITDNALVIHKEGADEDITIGPGILPIEQPDGTIVETDLNQYLQALQNRVTKVENNYLDAPFFTTDRDYMFSCMASNGLQETREVNINEALETIIYHVKRLLSIDHGVHFDPRSTLFNIPMIENSQLTFKEDTLYNALNAAFAYILGHEQVQNSGIAIYLDKVMLKKPLTFTEDGPKATGIVGDGTLLTKEYLASHVGEFFSTNDSISTTPEVILLKKPITFDVKGKTKATGIAGDGVLLTKEYLKKNINDFVEIVKDKESGLKFNPLSFIFAIANAGATAASWISLQSQINALWAFVESQEGIDTVLDTLGNLGPNHKGGFVDGIKNLVEKTKTSFQKITHIERFRNEGYMELESFDVTGPLEPIPMPRDANDEEEKDPGPKTIISTLSTLYPDFVTLVKVANTSRKNNNINMSGTDDLTDYLYLILAELAKKVEENKNNGGRTALKIADKADKSYVDEEIRKVTSKEYTLPQSVILKTIKGPEKDMYPGDGTTVKVNERVSFPSGIDAKEVYINGENINTTLFPLKNNEFTEPLTVKSIRSREDKPVIINKIGADNDQPVQIKKIRADDIILNYTLGSSAPQEDPHMSLTETLQNLNGTAYNMSMSYNNFKAHELPVLLDNKADKTYVNEQISKISNASVNNGIPESITVSFGNNDMGKVAIFINYNIGPSEKGPSYYTLSHGKSIELVFHKKDGTNLTIHPGDTFEFYLNDVTTVDYTYRPSNMFDMMYPIGSIFTSMSSTSPQTLYGGVWQPIVDQFLYCSNSSMDFGGSKTIRVENLPPHSHRFSATTSTNGEHSHSMTKRGYTNLAAGSDRQGMNRYDITDDPRDVSTGIFCGSAGNHTHTVAGITDATGKGQDFLPPFMTVFAWFRAA